jgi:hypothetical protein
MVEEDADVVKDRAHRWGQAGLGSVGRA